MRYVIDGREAELCDKIEPYAIYPPVNGYPIRPDSPKEIFRAVDELRALHKKIMSEIS